MTTFLSFSASRAVDGDITTRSCTLNYGGGQWWAVDIGQPTAIGAVKVFYLPSDGNFLNDRFVPSVIIRDVCFAPLRLSAMNQMSEHLVMSLIIIAYNARYGELRSCISRRISL